MGFSMRLLDPPVSPKSEGIIRAFRITLINAPSGVPKKYCTRLMFTRSSLLFECQSPDKPQTYPYEWCKLKSMLFVEDRVRIKFIDIREPDTFWCRFANSTQAKACQDVVQKHQLAQPSIRIGTVDRLRFKTPRKYVPLSATAAEAKRQHQLDQQTHRANNRQLGRSTSMLSTDSHIAPEFIYQPVSHVSLPIVPFNPEKVTPLDLDNFMCYTIFGAKLPTEYYESAKNVFAARYATEENTGEHCLV